MRPRIRFLARQARSLHVSAHTILHPTPSAVASHLSRAPPTSSILFSLSTSIDSTALLPLLSSIPKTGPRIGSFHVSPTGTPSLAIAVFTPEEGESVVPWRSSASGRGHAEVGKWQRPGTSWTEDTRGSEIGSLADLVEGRGWEGVWAQGGDEARIELGGLAKSVIALTDSTPAPVLQALGELGVASIGLVSAPTPFLTGRKHTLFYNDEVFEKGSVGLALSVQPAVEVAYDVEPIEGPHTIAASRGNLLLRFEEGDGNPTKALIVALKKRDQGSRGLTKDEDFWLAIMDQGAPTPRMVRILSGDPSRGALSLETDAPLVPGQVVQFMHRPGKLAHPEPAAGKLRFAVLPRTDEPVASEVEGQTRVLEGFLASSEGGFVSGVPPTVCTVSGARITAAF